jgi:hypothetical protein
MVYGVTMLDLDASVAVRRKLEQFGESNSVPGALARKLIEACAWWYRHPQSPTRAPGHAERVKKGTHGWELELGGNYFLVERAIIRSKSVIIAALEEASASNCMIDGRVLRGRLSTCVRESVGDYSHAIYPYYQGGAEKKTRRPLLVLGESGIKRAQMKQLDETSKGFMHFGTQAINVDDFVAAIWRELELNSICFPA